VTWLSALLVFGTLAAFGLNLSVDTPLPWLPSDGIIHGQVPWLLFAGLWGGVALGLASLTKGRNAVSIGLLLVEVSSAIGVTAYVFYFSVLPPHTLLIEVGDPFPGYTLADQDDTLHAVGALEERPPALYIFYRGHW
jgi:hypothetical protein